MQFVKPLRSGQITIPVSFRQELGIDDKTLLQITLDGVELRIKPVKIGTSARDSAWFGKLYDQFAPVRKEGQKYSSGQIDTSIKKALKAVRKSHV